METLIHKCLVKFYQNDLKSVRKWIVVISVCHWSVIIRLLVNQGTEELEVRILVQARPGQDIRWASVSVSQRDCVRLGRVWRSLKESVPSSAGPSVMTLSVVNACCPKALTWARLRSACWPRWASQRWKCRSFQSLLWCLQATRCHYHTHCSLDQHCFFCSSFSHCKTYVRTCFQCKY